MGVAKKAKKSRWKLGRVPFTLGPKLSHPKRVAAAIAEWNQKTNIVLFPRRPKVDKNYVEFRDATECKSHVGRKGGKQTVDLASKCSKTAIMHEIGHALGMYHEHQRPDRNNFVTVLLQNVKKGKERNFTLLRRSSIVLIGKYDFRSIMHYPGKAHAKGADPTLVAPGGETLNSSTSPTADDIAMVDLLYPVKAIRPLARKDYATRVITVVAKESGYPAKSIKESSSLAIDLGMNDQQKGKMARELGDIARLTNPFAVVRIGIVEKKKKVKDLIDLVEQVA